MGITEILEKVLKAGFTAENGCVSYHYNGKGDILTVIGERRTLVAYEKGKFYTPEEAKEEASRVYSGAVREPYSKHPY